MNVQQALDSIKVLLFPGDVTYSTASDEPVDLSPRYSVEQSIIPIRSVRSPLLTPIRDIKPVARTPVRSIAPLRGRVRNVPSLPSDVGPFYYPYQGNYEDYGPTTGLSGVIQGVTSMLNRSFGFVPSITSTMNRSGAGRLQSTLGAAPHITHQRHHVSSYPYHKSSHPETFGRKKSIRPLANHRWSTSKDNYGFGKVPGQWGGGPGGRRGRIDKDDCPKEFGSCTACVAGGGTCAQCFRNGCCDKDCNEHEQRKFRGLGQIWDLPIVNLLKFNDPTITGSSGISDRVGATKVDCGKTKGWFYAADDKGGCSIDIVKAGLIGMAVMLVATAGK